LNDNITKNEITAIMNNASLDSSIFGFVLQEAQPHLSLASNFLCLQNASLDLSSVNVNSTLHTSTLKRESKLNVLPIQTSSPEIILKSVPNLCLPASRQCDALFTQGSCCTINIVLPLLSSIPPISTGKAIGKQRN
jgi:hypothetical protein